MYHLHNFNVYNAVVLSNSWCCAHILLSKQQYFFHYPKWKPPLVTPHSPSSEPLATATLVFASMDFPILDSAQKGNNICGCFMLISILGVTGYSLDDRTHTKVLWIDGRQYCYY